MAASRNPACPRCGAEMARSAVDRHGWVCIERGCLGEGVDCSDCGQLVATQFCRCAAGCNRIVCDDCYLWHCEIGCRAARKATLRRHMLAGEEVS